MQIMVQFILFVCAVAIVIILGKWLLSLTGLSIPQPLLVVLGILVFCVLLLMFANWSGLWVWTIVPAHR
jgi:hypothetical protein